MYSIETKKRKIDRVLESINNPSSTPTLRTEAEPDPGKSSTFLSLPAKEVPKKRLRLSGENAEKAASKKSSTTSLQQQPNYLPHSQSAFLSRLSTFSSIQRWRISSSEDINAVEWARRGWSCVGTEEVACHGGCEAQMLVRLEEDEQPDRPDSQTVEEDDNDEKLVEERHKLLVQKYKDLIVTAHLPHCPWRRRGCDESIQRLALLNAQSSIQDLRNRYDAILSLPSDLPTNIRIGPDFPVIPSILSTLTSDASIFKTTTSASSSSSSGPWTQRNRTAFLLALTGWSSPTQSTPPSLSTTSLAASESDILLCTSCFRRLGLWLYRPRTPDSSDSTMEHLDALDSHLDFCPWRSRPHQCTELEIDGQKQKLSGFEILLRNVEHEARRIAPSKGATSRPVTRDGEDDAMSVTTAATTTEEREKRSKALLRKIRELKRPFNVKGLLRKKTEGGK